MPETLEMPTLARGGGEGPARRAAGAPPADPKDSAGQGLGAPPADPKDSAGQGLGAPPALACPSCGSRYGGGDRFCPYDGDPLVPAPEPEAPEADPLLGTLVEGRYVVRRLLGRGGMGTVYEVEHRTLGRKFALKVLKREIAGDPEANERFTREAKSAAAIGHPNIVSVSDFGQLELPTARGAARVPFFVMELLDGVSLAAELRERGPLDPRRAADVLVQIASALSAAHEVGVIHRDLKPENVFLLGPDRAFAKVVDFGVAKMAGVGKLTRAGRVFGTPHYMSPEQASGQPLDGRSDVYALGVLAYQCLAGRVPFDDATYVGVLTQHLYAEPPPLPPSAGALAEIVGRCLAKDPEARFASMAQLIAAIETTGAGTPAKGMVAVPRRPALRLRREERPLAPTRRLALPADGPGAGRWALIAGGALALAGALALGRSLRPEPAPVADRSAAVAPSPTPTAAPTEAAAAAAASPPAPAASPTDARSAPVASAPPPAPTGSLERRRDAPAPKRPAPRRPVKPGGIVEPW